MRTPEISPDIFERDRFSAVESVASRREFQDRNIHQIKNVPKDLAGGKLLVYFPEMNLRDGSAEIETYGFRDVNNLPGWDTWVVYFEIDPANAYGSFLISWIPPEFVQPVSDAICCNMEECIMWLSDSQLEFAKTLTGKNLLA